MRTLWLTASLIVVVLSGAVFAAPDQPATEEYPRILWSFDLKAPSLGSAAVGDIDGDNKPEIVFATYFNDEHIYALNAEDGSLLWKYNTGGCNDASALIYDVDGDGKMEVIAPASSPCKVYCFDGATGAVEWSADTGSGNCIDSPPGVADLDKDGKVELVLGTFQGNVFCLNGEDGSVCWHKKLKDSLAIQTDPGIADLDGDGQLDVLVAEWRRTGTPEGGGNRIYALKGNDGSMLWTSELPKENIYHGGSIADIDEDGKPEIAISCYDKHVYVLNGEDGSLLWQYAAPYYVGSPTSIADLNKDGHLEIVFAAYDQVGALSHTGKLLWSHTIDAANGSVFRGGTIADIDGDGTLDVAFGSHDGVLRVLSGDSGRAVWKYDLKAHYGKEYLIDHAPIIADFNGDGRLDIFVVGGHGESTQMDLNHGRCYALAAGVGTGPGWPMFRHDVRHTGVFRKPSDANSQPKSGD